MMNEEATKITNEEAIKILKNKMDGSVDTSYEWVETVRLAVNALEKQSGWILCNEKAPLPEQEILLFDDNFGIVVGKYVCVAYPDGKEYRYLIHKSIDSDLMGAINPIAWMPLPQPYKESEEEE